MECEALESIKEVIDNRPWKLVTHIRPDTDALCCLWAATRFVVPAGADIHYIFVEAGEHLPEDEKEGFNVLHMDTGGGMFDQHGKCLERSSSFELFAKHYLAKDPAIRLLVEWTRRTDNVERLNPTDLHFIFRGLPHALAGEENADFQMTEFAFQMLDILYGQEKRRIEAIDSYKTLLKAGEIHEKVIATNKVNVATLLWHPELREVAFARGADVVIFTSSKGKKRDLQVCIQVGRDSPVTLRKVAKQLRFTEAKLRGMSIDASQAEEVGGNDFELSTWFLHDSCKLLAAGTKKRPLRGEECTKISQHQIVKIVHDELSRFRFKR